MKDDMTEVILTSCRVGTLEGVPTFFDEGETGSFSGAQQRAKDYGCNNFASREHNADMGTLAWWALHF